MKKVCGKTQTPWRVEWQECAMPIIPIHKDTLVLTYNRAVKWYWRSFIGIWIVSFLCSCAARIVSPSDVYRTNQQLLGPALKAANTWCEATDGIYCPAVDAEYGIPIYPVHGDRYCGLHSKQKGIRIYVDSVDEGACDRYELSDSAWCRETGECIHGPYASGWRKLTREEVLQVIILHELGHAANAVPGDPDGHLPGCGHVMSAGGCPWRPIYATAEDVQAVLDGLKVRKYE